jgi:hypothetical protein
MDICELHRKNTFSIIFVFTARCIATEVIRLLTKYSLPWECVYRVVAQQRVYMSHQEEPQPLSRSATHCVAYLGLLKTLLQLQTLYNVEWEGITAIEAVMAYLKMAYYSEICSETEEHKQMCQDRGYICPPMKVYIKDRRSTAREK